MLPLEYAERSDIGNNRDNNEDSYFSDPQSGLWLIADGMGGHAAGEVASAIARDTIAAAISSGVTLTVAVQNAHSAILHAATKNTGASGMGTTVVALQCRNNHYEVAWVGDSRAYLWSPDQPEGHLRQLTTDHSHVQTLVDSGAIQAEEAAGHPDKNILSRCLGWRDVEQVKVDTVQDNWQQKQWIILCSDGLTEKVSDKNIAALLAQASNPDAAVQLLISTALQSGGQDNITVQVIAAPNAAGQYDNASSTDREERNYLLPALLLAAGILLLFWIG